MGKHILYPSVPQHLQMQISLACWWEATALHVQVVGDNGWSKVDYNGQTGYIKSEYLTATKPAAASDSTQQTTGEKAGNEELFMQQRCEYPCKGIQQMQDVIGTLIAGYSITRNIRQQWLEQGGLQWSDRLH